MRCIEISETGDYCEDEITINRNMRCIEINAVALTIDQVQD